MEKTTKIKLAKTGINLFGCIKIISLLVMIILMISGLFKKAPDTQLLNYALVLMGSVLIALISILFEEHSENSLARLEKAA